MTIIWNKKGLIYQPSNANTWMKSFAQAPCPLLYDYRIRIFFTCRGDPDGEGNYISYISYLDTEISDPRKVIYVNDKPVIELGGLGKFDEYGIHPATLMRYKGKIFFYYQGWTRMERFPYSTHLGLAISKDNGMSFQKYSKDPLIIKSKAESNLENGFFVLEEKGKFYMWYATVLEWLEIEGKKKEPVYQIVFARSRNGKDWESNETPLLNSVYEKEASGRPTVIKINDMYHMWFCYRNVLDFRTGGKGAYRIGYAYSKDKLNWTRNDANAGIDLSIVGWDSEMMAYPYVIKVKNKLFMFYNGNEFGKYGFGFAEGLIVN